MGKKKKKRWWLKKKMMSRTGLSASDISLAIHPSLSLNNIAIYNFPPVLKSKGIFLKKNHNPLLHSKKFKKKSNITENDHEHWEKPIKCCKNTHSYLYIYILWIPWGVLSVQPEFPSLLVPVLLFSYWEEEHLHLSLLQ